MSIDNNRLLMELEQHRREINKDTINPAFREMAFETLEPVLTICAQARSSYIECLMTIANDQQDSAPSSKQIEQLKQHRVAYEELVRAANALETVIERGYVDVTPK